MSADMKRLYRSQDDRIIAGVAGGLGKYLNVDPTVVRLLFAMSAFVGGGGFLVYLAMMLLVPEAPLAGADQPAEPAEVEIIEEE